MGMGKRIVLGNALMTLAFTLLVLSGCKKDTPATTANSTTNTSSYYLRAMLGTEEIQVAGEASQYTDVTAAEYQDNDNDHHGNSHADEEHHNEQAEGDGDGDEDDQSLITSGCAWNTTNAQGKMMTTGTIEVSGLVVRIWVNPALAPQYYNLYTPGQRGYAFDANSKTGAYVALRDKNGVLWTSKGPQTESTFEITSRGENNGVSTTVSGTFNCKMYDGNGNVQDLKNGTFTAIVGLQ